MALPSISCGSNAWMPSRCRVGARFSSTGCSVMTSSSTSQTTGPLPLDHPLGGLDVLRVVEVVQPLHHERLEQLQRHRLGQTALVQLELRADHDRPNGRSSRRACRAGSDGTGPACPSACPRCDFSGRLPGPVTGRPRRPLSNSESTASCSIRFSLLTMISGAPRSSSRFSRLFRLITRRYRSLRSDVANRPPSSCTIGRRSGGITGTQSSTMPVGAFLVVRKAETTLSRFRARVLRWPLPVWMVSRSDGRLGLQVEGLQPLLDRVGAHRALEVLAEPGLHLPVEHLVALEVLRP